jgi:AcrR family transcriptional regulator
MTQVMFSYIALRMRTNFTTYCTTVEQSGESRREYKKRLTRQRLLDSAWGLFQDRGYDQATIEDITRGADVAKSTFFNYFESKQAILDEIALRQIDDIGARALADGNIPDSVLDRIKLVIKAIVETFSSKQELTQRIFLLRISAPVAQEGAHRLGTIVHKMVLQGQSRGEVRADVEAALVSRLLMTCMFYSLVETNPDPHLPGDQNVQARASESPRTGADLLSAEQAFTQSVDALMDGLKGPKWRES